MRWAIVNGKRVPGVKQPDGSVIPADEINKPVQVEGDQDTSEE